MDARQGSHSVPKSESVATQDTPQPMKEDPTANTPGLTPPSRVKGKTRDQEEELGDRMPFEVVSRPSGELHSGKSENITSLETHAAARPPPRGYFVADKVRGAMVVVCRVMSVFISDRGNK